MQNTNTKLRRYGLVCLGDVSYFESPLVPDQFVEHMLAVKQILNITERAHFEIWQKDDGGSMWFPLYGVESPIPLMEITGPPEKVFKREKEKEYTKLGDKAVKLYTIWKNDVKQLARHIQSREESGRNSDHLKREYEELIHSISLIDEIVAGISIVKKTEELRELFELKYRQIYECEKISQLMHRSSSTVNRLTTELKCLIGADLHKVLSNAEIEEKFHVEWKYEKWRFSRTNDL